MVICLYSLALGPESAAPAEAKSERWKGRGPKPQARGAARSLAARRWRGPGHPAASPEVTVGQKYVPKKEPR